MLTETQALQSALDKLPTGFAWTREADSNWARQLSPAAQAQVDFETAAEAQLAEATSSTTMALLEDYERVLGPDPCLGPLATFDGRRLSVHARWTARGGASRAHYIGIAAALGTAIAIEEFAALRVDDPVDAPTLDEPWNYVWSVSAADPLVSIPSDQAAIVRCTLERLRPAPTVIIFDLNTFRLDASDLDGGDGVG